MSQRTLKNYTNEDLVLEDIGDITIPANGALDIGGNEQHLLELASSDDLLNALAKGITFYQLNDGIKDLSMSSAIDLTRKIQRPTEVDELGRWVVRSDSRKQGLDVVFQGSGDNCITKRSGDGIPFTFDFSAVADDVKWDNENAPVGYKQQIIDWQFCDWVYIKEGTLYFYNMPKGSFINFEILAPPGTYGLNKSLNEKQEIIKTYFPTNEDWYTILQWVVDYHIEGSAPMGDELNTESAAENPSPDYFIWRAIVNVPETEGWESAHGHWSLEVYRSSMGPLGPRKTTSSKMVTWPPV